MRWALKRCGSAAQITTKIAHVLNAIADISPVLPHPVELKITNGADSVLRALGDRGDFDNRSLIDAHALERLENAIFVFCAQCHCLNCGTTRHPTDGDRWNGGPGYPLHVVVMAKMNYSLIVNEANAELFQPTSPAQDVAPNERVRREIHDRVELPIKTSECHLVSVHLKLAVSRGYHFLLTIGDLQAELFSILLLKDAERRAGVDFRKEPHRALANCQNHRNSDAFGGVTVIMAHSKCECGGKVLPTREGRRVLRLN